MRIETVCLATAVLVGVLVSHGEAAVDCYGCSGDQCKDEYTGSTSHKETGCVYCSKIKTKVQDAQSVVRSCVRINISPEMKCASAKSGDSEVHTCFCNKSLCNPGVKVTLGVTSLLGALLLHWLL